jgi:hypothetical protein
MSKPVIGIPYINRPDLLNRLITSLEYSKGINVRSFDFRVVINAVDYMRYDCPTETVFSAGHNLGVAASWNTIIKTSPLAPYWIIFNSDILLGSDDLLKIKDFVEPRLDTHALFFCYGMSAFVITPLALQTIGWFDENIHPAYLEDCDYHYRAKLAGLTMADIPNLEIIHGEKEWDGYKGSCVIRSDPQMLQENGRTHQGNFEYYRQKWGGINGEETFTSPFDNPNYGLNYWSLDFDRLKRQQWNL